MFINKHILYGLYFLILCTQKTSILAKPLVNVSFDQAMVCNQADQDAYECALMHETDAPFFAYAQEKYNKHILNQSDYSVTPRIPKIIHQIWIGPDAPPEKFKEWQQSWLAHHPDWEYKLWTDVEVAQFPLINKEQFDHETNYGAKADILRLEILDMFGGLYVDIDGECLQPFDALHHLCDFYIGFFQVNFLRSSARVNNAFMAACPGHALIKHMIHELSYLHAPDITAEWMVVERTGPSFVTKVIKENICATSGINILLPANFFYPWTGTQRKLKLAVQPETMAIHHYTGSWKAKITPADVYQTPESAADRKKKRERKKATLLKAYTLLDKAAVDESQLELDISALTV